VGHDRIEDALDVSEGGNRDADAVEGASRRLAGLQLLVAPTQRSGQRVDPAEGERGEDRAQHERHGHHEQGVERERERFVEKLVAHDLDDAHDERGHDDEEPADAIGHLHLAADAGGVPRGVARSIRRCRRGSDRSPGQRSGCRLNRGVPSPRGA